MNLQEQRLMANLIRNRRWAALATQGPEGPEASWVTYVPQVDFSGFLLHLSTLASHTGNLLANSRAGLAISEMERDGADPQTLARVMIKGRVTAIPKDSTDYREMSRHYQATLPTSTPRFEFGDFLLLRLTSAHIRFVSGFARAYTLDHIALRVAAQRTS